MQATRCCRWWRWAAIRPTNVRRGDEAHAGARALPEAASGAVGVGATVGRTRLMRLAGMAEVKRHVDQGYYWAERVRIHVPIVTQPTVRFECGGQVVNMAAGECWIFDTWRQHRVDKRRHRIATWSSTRWAAAGSGTSWIAVAFPAQADGWQPQIPPPGRIPAPFCAGNPKHPAR